MNQIKLKPAYAPVWDLRLYWQWFEKRKTPQIDSMLLA